MDYKKVTLKGSNINAPVNLGNGNSNVNIENLTINIIAPTDNEEMIPLIGDIINEQITGQITPNRKQILFDADGNQIKLFNNLPNFEDI